MQQPLEILESPRVSVAMCTYQGVRFVAEQLASIAAQSRTPDEVVILDDGSSDGTVETIREFARRAAFPVRVDVNERQLGWARNFEKVIGCCGGDVIFFADQDDVWSARKIESMLGAFARSDGIGFVFCDGEVVDESLAPLGVSIWDALRFSDADRRALEADGGIDCFIRKFRHVVAPGMTLSFRAAFRDLLLPFADGWWHDAWIPIALTAVGARGAVVPERLVLWRQHASQQTGLPAVRILENRARMTIRDRSYEGLSRRCRSLLERLERKAANFPPDAGAVAILRERLGHAQARQAIRGRKWRIGAVLAEARTGNYQRYSRGWWSVAKDLLG